MSDQLDPRQQLAKMDAEIEAARKKAEELEKAHGAKRANYTDSPRQTCVAH
jgi:hypothetical protein